MQREGLIRHVGLSEVSVEEIEAARKFFPVATVQNLYNLTMRKSEDVLDYCERERIGFIPWFPLAGGDLARAAVLDGIATKLGDAVADRARLGAQAQSGDAADPGHRQGARTSRRTPPRRRSSSATRISARSTPPDARSGKAKNSSSHRAWLAPRSPFAILMPGGASLARIPPDDNGGPPPFRGSTTPNLRYNSINVFLTNLRCSPPLSEQENQRRLPCLFFPARM